MDRFIETHKFQLGPHIAENVVPSLTVTDKYGAINPAEFFAVATECFFEKPIQLRRKHSQLYEELKRYYRQDPASFVSS